MTSSESERSAQGPIIFSEEEAAVRRAAFQIILTKRPASPQAIAQRTGLSSSTVSEAISNLVASDAVALDRSGAVVASRGLTLTPTTHHLRMLDYDFYGWWAQDVVGISAALGVDAKITSACHDCGREIAIEIRKGEVASVTPGDIHLWIPERPGGPPSTRNTWGLTNFFCSVEHLDEWRKLNNDPSGHAATLQEARDRGKELWAADVASR